MTVRLFYANHDVIFIQITSNITNEILKLSYVNI
jgi:hypothetical protein